MSTSEQEITGSQQWRNYGCKDSCALLHVHTGYTVLRTARQTDRSYIPRYELTETALFVAFLAMAMLFLARSLTGFSSEPGRMLSRSLSPPYDSAVDRCSAPFSNPQLTQLAATTKEKTVCILIARKWGCRNASKNEILYYDIFLKVLV